MPLSACVVLLATGVLLLGEQGWMWGKAYLAERLIAHAFDRFLRDGQPQFPWPGADFHPIARLSIPRLALTRYVLTGGSGTSMAFGLGHMDGTALPGTDGNTVLVGHRDTWMRFAKDLAPGDTLWVDTPLEHSRYVVQKIHVVPEWDLGPLAAGPRSQVTLITCYPFDALLRGPRRCVVRCTEQDPGERCLPGRQSAALPTVRARSPRAATPPEPDQ